MKSNPLLIGWTCCACIVTRLSALRHGEALHRPAPREAYGHPQAYMNVSYAGSGQPFWQFVQAIDKPSNFPPNFLTTTVHFNPSVTELPPDTAARLHPQARYVAVVRHTSPGFVGLGYGQCWQLGKNTRYNFSKGSKVVVLDGNMTTLQSASIRAPPGDTTLAHEGDSLFLGKDGRLFTDGDRVLITFSVGIYNEFEVRQLKLYRSEKGKLYAYAQRLGGLSGLNIGMLSHNSTLYALMWVAPEVKVEALSLRRTTTPELHLHNSINPLPLPDMGAFLGIGHAHGVDVPKAERKNNTFLWHSHYLNYFVLFEDQPPFRIKQISRGFCIPSSVDRNKCEVIQFIMSALRLPNDNILLTYGANDCESRAVHVPLRAILDFIDAAKGDAQGQDEVELPSVKTRMLTW